MLMLTQIAGFGAGGKVALSSIVQQASATSTASTIAAPADIQAGDLLVLLDRALGFLLPSTVVPTNFTSIDNQNDGATTRQILSCKLAVGTEASASITGMAGNTANRKILVVFRPNVPAVNLTVASAAGEQTDGNPTSQVATASGGVAPLVVIGGFGGLGTVNPRSFSPAKDGEVENQPGSNNNSVLAWKIYNSSPSNVSIDMDDEGSENILQSCYIACS